MLAKLFGKKSDHPMSDLKSAQGLLDELPQNDDYKSLMELTDWMESVTSNTEFKLDHQLALIGMIDEASYVHTRKLTREYFVEHELSQFQENRLWLVLGNWYRRAREGYYTAFSRYCEGDKNSSLFKAKLPLLAARTLRAMTLELKFCCVRYAAVDRNHWSMLGVMYKHAEREQYLDSPVSLYPALPQQTTVKLEAGHLLAWYGCGVSSLTPLSMHITERVVAQYYATVSVHNQPSVHSLFGFDLNAAVAPRRVNVDATLHPYMRFVGLADMVPHLAKLLKILDKNIVPDDLILGGDYDAAVVRQAVEHLHNFVTTLPQRRMPRRPTNINIKVVSGYNKIVDSTDVGLDFNSDSVSDWQIQDISAIGFHAVLPEFGNRDVGIGQLLGIQAEGVGHWGVAVIRRLMRGENHQVHVGAEIISNQILGVALQVKGGGNSTQHLALWLYPKAGESAAEISLLMKSEAYQPNCSYQTEVAGKQLLLLPIGMLQKNIDCDLVRFRVVEQQAAGDDEE
ncbi:MAG: hypothetical protein ABL915_07985 [Gallionella sp.]